MTRRKTAVYRDRHVWFFGSLALFLAVFTLYIYFVSSSVVQVVMRKEYTQDITEVASYINQLEAEYIATRHAVSDDIASLEGYVAVEDKEFINRAPSTVALSVQ